MKKMKHKNKFNTEIIVISIVLSIFIISFLLNKSYGYKIEQLEKGNILIGNDVYEGYIGPNKLISSSINYYKETKDKDPLVLYKYEGKNNKYETWSYLNDKNQYVELSNEGIIKLEIKRIIHNAKEKIDTLNEEELILNSSYHEENKYYFFDKDLINLGILFTRNIVGYLIYENKEIINYNFTYENVKHDNYDKENDPKFIKVSDYGAIPNDDIDDTEAIKRAVEMLNNNNGGILYFDKGIYDVSLEEFFSDPELSGVYLYQEYLKNSFSIIEIKNITEETIIDFNGATLKLKENSLPKYKILNINNCKNVIVVNGNFIGDRLGHEHATHEDVLGDYSKYIKSHAWGHGIGVTHSNVIMSNIKVDNFTGDGISLADINPALVTNAKIYNTEISNCRRMGLTIMEVNSVYANDLYIHRIGDFDDITGTLPKSGIDIESEYTRVPTNYINFENLKIEETTNLNIVSDTTKNFTKDFYISNSYFDGKNSFPNAKITDSYFLMNTPNMTTTLKNAEIDNCHFDIIENNTWLSLLDSTVNNSILVGNYSDTSGNYLRTKNTKINNSTITRFRGYHETLTNANNTYTGIQLDYSILENFNSNHYIDNYFVVAAGTATENNFYMKNSIYENNTFNITGRAENENNNIYINNSTFKNNEVIANSYKNKVTVNIDDSKLIDSDFGYFKNIINNTYIELNNNKNKNIFDYESTLNNTTIFLNSELKNNSILNNTLLNNNTKVILEKYNNQNPLNIKEGSSNYEIIYNGNNTLNK